MSNSLSALWTPARREKLRFLVATIVVALLYIGLEELFSSGIDWMQARGRLTAFWTEAQEAEARRIAVEAAARESQLDPQLRRSAWRLGLQLGYQSEVLGSFALSDPLNQARARQAIEDDLRRTAALGALFGIPNAAPLFTRNVTEFGQLPQRIDADESGIAARVEAATTARHKQLLLLGMQVGAARAAFEIAGELRPTPNASIAVRARLAGLPARLWQPLARVPGGASPEEVAAAYRRAIDTLDRALGDPALFAAAPAP